MSFRKHEHEHEHHHHHHHPPPPCEEEEYYSGVYEGERIYGAPPPPPSAAYYEGERVYGAPPSAAHYGQEHNFKRNERLGELGAVAAGAFAVYEGHKAKIDPEHASRHNLEAGTAALGALGSAGYAYHEHREKKKYEDGYW